MNFHLQRHRADKLNKQSILQELQRVAEHYSHRRFTCNEFDAVAAGCKATTVLRAFSTWDAALAIFDPPLAPYRARRADAISENDLFTEMERVWRYVGQRPSQAQWEEASPRIAYGTYYKRFNGWMNACAAFIEYLSLKQTSVIQSDDGGQPVEAHPVPLPTSASDRRGIPMKLRYQVLVRDNFKCVTCGRSPATHAGGRIPMWLEILLDYVRRLRQNAGHGFDPTSARSRRV